MSNENENPIVGVCMGSRSDLPTMKAATDVLRDFGVPHETRIVSAHRTPDHMFAYAREARDRGLRVLIAGAGGAAHLPGMLAALSTLPVIGVPVAVGNLAGADALLSIVQMPRGCPVATVAIGQAANAAFLAVRILATTDPGMLERLDAHHAATAADVLGHDLVTRQARVPK
jgi:phosphoribosylaminoimidazole carboxylase PurE protein